ncbi:hypothetical protein CXF94_08025 [Halomonas sp. Choline-3u-9]|nr:hypothetical protein CXF94_08025 [Halomonas sp. Choline-3u-9]
MTRLASLLATPLQVQRITLKAGCPAQTYSKETCQCHCGVYTLAYY